MAAGVKRKSEELESDPRVIVAKTERDGAPRHGAAPAPQNRFQLSVKAGVSEKPSQVPHRPSPNPAAFSSSQKAVPKPIPKSAAGTDTSTPSPTAPRKRGFASIMEKAKAAQEAAKAVGPSGIKHKAVEKMNKRERRKMLEEAKAQQRAGKGSKLEDKDQSRHGDGASGLQKGHETSYKGTMRKAAEPLSYKGTMRTAAPSESRDKKQNGQAQDKYGGYASWSDLDDAEDEEEDYDSEGSSDMEGGFDDVEREEVSATRAARKEDQEFLEEEERHKREKLERKRKLEELSESAAVRKRY